MMIVLPYATSLVGLLIVSALLGIGLGAIDTCKQNLSSLYLLPRGDTRDFKG